MEARQRLKQEKQRENKERKHKMFEGTAQEVITLIEYFTKSPGFTAMVTTSAVIVLGITIITMVFFWKIMKRINREFEEDPFFNPKKRDKRK